MDYSNCDYEFQQGYMEDTDFSETTKFITQILMEENFDLRPYYDPLSLQITEKSFFDALSPNQHPLHFHNSDQRISSTSNSSTKPLSPDTLVSDLGTHVFQFISPLSTSVSDGLVDLDSSITNLLAQNIFGNADSVSQFKRGFEEANKFLPPQPQLLTSLESSNFNIFEEKDNSVVLKGRKNHEREEDEEGRRNNKQSAIGGGVDEDELSEMFDKALLNDENDCFPNENTPSAGGAKARPKKHNSKNETIDLRNLLLLCSQALYANDNRNARELLKQIRKHTSLFGDASQRVTHYFANGLEARLVGEGAGAQTFYSSPSTKRITAAEFLKTYQVHFISPPFNKFVYLFANKMIMKVAEKAETLHIIDFGIHYGFQCPMLIKYLSNREGGPPKFRITGIEFPLPGFCPTGRIEETGRRLANYCKSFSVPFEYNIIASQNWEKIRVEDVRIESNEVISVNCMTRFKNLIDESIKVNSPRNAVLHFIRKINPDIFTLSVINGSYNSPFFATRFREA
ncbi:scarecrow-like protein 14 [Trifolium pratense]|uniref:scarecrow-like protein 14 n=1 Tax=Trifolium pratense TaxID=57577 RepID=UPI001E694FF7|nr:scarecrow-like protein 14 [Trifolium pratense]